MISLAWEQVGVSIAGSGAGQAHKSRDMNGIYGADDDMACEIELVANGAGSLVFCFASVSKPGPMLVQGDGARAVDLPQDPDKSYTAAQLAPGAAEQFILTAPEAGRFVYSVPNFKSAGRYLHTWFSAPDDPAAPAMPGATAIVRVNTRSK